MFLQHFAARTIMDLCITFVKLTMSSISSISSTTSSSATSATQQAAVQQAKREADQAENAAQTLESQAANAQTRATQAEGYARTLNIQAGQAQLGAGYSEQHLSALQLSGQINNEIVSGPSYTPSTSVQQALAYSLAPPPATVPQSTSPVLNTQGQVTGKIINTSA